MKRFLTKVVLFSIALWVMAVVLDYILCRGLLQMEDSRFQDYSAMLSGGMEHDILIMGNSRGKSHFDPFLIDSLCKASSFCIGIGGYPFNVQLAKYQLYKEHNKKPKTIIQNVDHGTIAILTDIRHQHQSEQFFPLVYDPVGRKELRKMGYGFKELFIPLYRFGGYQMDIKNGLLEALHIKHYISRPAYKGHRPEEGQWDGTELEKMSILPIQFSNEAKALFEEYMDQCERDSIKVILVNSPMYVGAFEKMTGVEEMREYYRMVAETHHTVYLDYTENCEISQDTSNFCVSVHMNPQATRSFTELFCKDMLELGLVAHDDVIESSH